MTFYSAENFPELAQLKYKWKSIRDEYDALAREAIQYPQEIHNGKWTAIGMKFQDKSLKLRARAPITTAACESILGVHTYGFSILAPNCEIRPHYGITNKVIRVHLGLYVNASSAIMVGNEVRAWKEGELLIFDDTKIHSAWNRGNTDRVILLLDFYKNIHDQINDSERVDLNLN